MQNDRPIDDPRLQKALDEVKELFARYGFAGACMIVAPRESAFVYKLHAPWSAWRYDPTTPMGFRFRAVEADEGKEKTKARVEGGIHTICMLADFGQQTMDWMEQMKLMLRQVGIDFDHTPFGGKPLGTIVGVNNR